MKSRSALIFSGVFLLVGSLGLSSCGKFEEKIEPLYPPEKLELRDARVQLWQDLGLTVIEPGLVRKVTRNLVGWIPGVGELLELPLDLTSVILPPLSSVSHPELSKDKKWSDPEILKVLKSLKLGAGYIRTVSFDERSPKGKREKCWFFFDCPEESFEDFLSELRVYLVFQDIALNRPSPKEQVEVLLAKADIKKNYHAEVRSLEFEMTEEDIRPYLESYGNFTIKIIARGRYPKHNVYIDGRLRIDLEIKISMEN
jgi:hypothetical protein